MYVFSPIDYTQLNVRITRIDVDGTVAHIFFYIALH